MIGAAIGHYRVTAKLGQGSTGEVYRATDTTTGRDAAIQVLTAALTEDAGRLARLVQDVQALVPLQHPNVAAIYGMEGRAVVMEMVEGRGLDDRIARGPMAMAEALEILRQVLDGLQYAHEQGVEHRSLKSSDIRIAASGMVKILGWQRARAWAGSSEAAGPYAAPEQATGLTVDQRADIWAFGVIAYEMMTGRKPFAGLDAATEEPDWDAVPPEMLRLLHLCLAKDRSQRLRRIADVRVLLPEMKAAPPVPAIATSHRRANSWIVAAILAVAVLAAAWLLWRAIQSVGP